MGYQGIVNFPWQGTEGQKILKAVYDGKMTFDEAVEFLRKDGWAMTARKFIRAYNSAVASRQFDPDGGEAVRLVNDVRQQLKNLDIASDEIQRITTLIARRLQSPRLIR